MARPMAPDAPAVASPTATRAATDLFASERPRRRWRRDGFLATIAMYAAISLMALIVLFPIYWMVSMSFKTPREINRVPALVPQELMLENYRELIVEREFLTAIRNSAIVATSVTVVALAIASIAAYSQVRFHYRFRGVLGRVILLAYLMPTSLLFIPMAIIVARVSLGNSLYGLVVIYMTFALPVATWMLTNFFRSVPRDLEEQAMVDGASRLRSFRDVILPLSVPGLAAVSIFTFTGAWNELLFALIFITSEDLRTVSLALQYLITGDVYRWGQIMAGATLASLPVVILYFVAQRFIVQGGLAGGVKG